jgi:hypothetical protein
MVGKLAALFLGEGARALVLLDVYRTRFSGQ